MKHCSAMSKPAALVVDDFASMRSVVAEVLKKVGFTDISQASNGRTALARLAENKQIGLVVSDWHMPEMNGLELLQAIKANPELAHIPVLMITAEGQRNNVIDAMQCGATGYIVKPFTPTALQNRLEKMFP
jgi:two-component system chemotaxis response regulator CheY